MPNPCEYYHVDVFADAPYSGNSLAVFPDAGGLDGRQMLRITQELRHFESIFLEPVLETRFRARVFDLLEELPFAGHPVIGAAAVMHRLSAANGPKRWEIDLSGRTVCVDTEVNDGLYWGLMDQGAPEFLGTTGHTLQFASAFGLDHAQLELALPLEVVSTGLRYLIVPVRSGALEHARITVDITEMLRQVNAQFAVLFDAASMEIRHWNNDGLLEDVATGSAAGAVGAYGLRHGLVPADETFVLNQGRFTGRPSRLWVRPEGSGQRIESIKVGGDVRFVGRGVLEAVPSAAP
jgi:PhzF family phenazine biosynthesis protein